MQELIIRQPDDWHIHLRDGAALAHTVADASRYFGRAIVMPNLTPPVVSVDDALRYRDRILAQRPPGSTWRPLMTLYLTDNTTPAEIAAAGACEHIYAAKLYPAGATTNSDSGVTDPSRLGPVLAAMERHGLPLLVHGEVTDPAVDIFDREAVFIDTVLSGINRRFPALRIVLEHITTAEAVDFVRAAPATVAATITAHHLLFNRNHMLAGGIRPHYYCLPILKKSHHQQQLVAAATSGSGKFFLGTDSAPHAVASKEAACGCAGCYTAHTALPLYAEAFERAGALARLESFASEFGPRFYGLPLNERRVRLVRQPWTVPRTLPLGDASVVPLLAGETLRWHAQLQ